MTLVGMRRDLHRSDCYRLLASCFCPPDREQWLRDRTCLELAAALDELYPGTAAAGHVIALHEQLTKLSQLELQVDHAALFVGPFALKAPPYGSVYLDQNRMLMGETTVAANACYAAAGLTLALRDCPDHITVELEFLQYLAARGVRAAAQEERDEAERLADERRRFLTQHLGAWVPSFCAALRSGAETPFYRLLADCLQTFIEAETHILSDAAEPDGPYDGRHKPFSAVPIGSFQEGLHHE